MPDRASVHRQAGDQPPDEVRVGAGVFRSDAVLGHGASQLAQGRLLVLGQFG